MSWRAWVIRNFPGVVSYVDRPRKQLKELKTAVRRAQNTTFYGRRLKEAGVTSSSIRSLQDFTSKVPVTTREELLEQDPYDLLAIEPGTETILYGQTSGSTGNPVPVWASLREMQDGIELALALPVFRNNLHPSDRVALCYPYTRTLAGRSADLLNLMAGCTVIPIGTRNNMYPPEMAAATIARLRPTILGAAATDAFAYANILKDQGIDPTSLGIRLVVSGAEPCAPARAEALGRVYGAKVLSLLGQNEIGFPGIPCELNHMHVPQFMMYTELVHPDGSPAQPGERANTIVTPTFKRAQPLLRYVTGDTVIWHTEPCECGLPLPRMEILGRAHTMIETNGHGIFPIELEDALYRAASLDGVWYQIRVRADDVLVRAEHRDTSQYEEMSASIEKELGRLTGRPVRVELIAPGSLYDYREIRPGKPLSRVVDEVAGTEEVVEGM
ncbi:MAG: phenylacetate--CoA ligase family protein [Thermoplasmata archaeon]|nr:MAG: phenylacetate--CoA ligase family protein [Thermoplasmata archaeon]